MEDPGLGRTVTRLGPGRVAVVVVVVVVASKFRGVTKMNDTHQWGKRVFCVPLRGSKGVLYQTTS